MVVKIPFASGDVVIIPPYTTYQFIAHAPQGFRAWLPQIRLWHGQGLLWRDPMANGKVNMKPSRHQTRR